MELNGVDVTPLPLMARKMKLGTLLKRYDHGSLRYSEPFADPEKLLRECSRRGLEGIVSRKKDAPYRWWMAGCGSGIGGALGIATRLERGAKNRDLPEGNGWRPGW